MTDLGAPSGKPKPARAQTNPASDDTMLCVLCDTVFWRGEPPGVLAIMHAHRDDLSTMTAVGNGICYRTCARHRPLRRLKNVAIAKLRSSLNAEFPGNPASL